MFKRVILARFVIARSIRLMSSTARMEEQHTFIINHPDEEAVVQMQFVYAEKEFGFERVFNLNRQPEEDVTMLSSKITSAVEKFLSKKANKWLKKQQSAEGAETALDPELVAPPAQVLLDGVPAPAQMSCREALVTHAARAHVRIGRRLYAPCVNPPAVGQLELPSYIMTGFPVRPTCLQLAFANVSDSEMTWHRQLPDGSWEQVSDGGNYIPGVEDVGRRLRLTLTPGSGDRRGTAFSVDSEPVEAGPGPCPFQQRHIFTNQVADQNTYRIVSYNILADLYADSDFTRSVLHPYCPPYALHIDYRRQLMLSELNGYNGDLFCLQEVDKKVFDNDLTPSLGEGQLQGIYTVKGGQVSEGLVCFYRNSKFRHVGTARYVLGELVSEDPLFADIERACEANPALRERLTKRTQTLQVVLLEPTVAPNRLLVVGNTHLYFHPNADHIRALQIGMCMRLLQRTIETLSAQLQPGPITVPPEGGQSPGRSE